MPLAITSEHQDLAESVRALVRRVAPAEFLHAALETPIGTPPPYWSSAADQACTACIWPSRSADRVRPVGAGDRDRRVRLRRRARPVRPSAIAGALIAAHDPNAELLAELAAGRTVATFALESELTATRYAGNVIIRGEARSVPAAADAAVLVLPVAIESGIEWVVL